MGLYLPGGLLFVCQSIRVERFLVRVIALLPLLSIPIPIPNARTSTTDVIALINRRGLLPHLGHHITILQLRILILQLQYLRLQMTILSLQFRHILIRYLKLIS